MVARKDDAEGLGSNGNLELFPRVFTTWRALLTRLGKRIVEITHPSDAQRARQRRLFETAAPFAAGMASVLAGAAGSLALAGAGLNRATWVAALSTVVWGLGRLLVLELVLHSEIRGRRLLQAWSWGLVPYVIAVIPALELLAWLLSGASTWWLLQRAGLRRSSASRGVVVAWAVQSTFTLIAWVIVNGWVALIALG